jgi:hypothetical protein
MTCILTRIDVGDYETWIPSLVEEAEVVTR